MDIIQNNMSVILKTNTVMKEERTNPNLTEGNKVVKTGL